MGSEMTERYNWRDEQFTYIDMAAVFDKLEEHFCDDCEAMHEDETGYWECPAGMCFTDVGCERRRWLDRIMGEVLQYESRLEELLD